MISEDKSDTGTSDNLTEYSCIGVTTGSLIPKGCSSNNVIDLNEQQENEKSLNQSENTFCEPSVNLTFPPTPSNKVITPKYVVRPGPVAPMPKYVVTEFGTQHALDRVIWTTVFSFLTKSELARCMRVCKTWHRWCLDSYFWRRIDLSSRTICQNHLIGVVRRQPRELNLQDAVISKKQLVWLIARLPHLKVLNLRNNTWAAVNALCFSACPLLEKLDISWCNGIWDDCIRDLVSPPTDHRPGVDESISRLHRCAELHLAGTNITDLALEVIGTYMPHLTKLDLGYCSSITDKGLIHLSDDGAVTKSSIRELNLKYLRQLTDGCFTPLAEFTNIQSINLQHCRNVSFCGCQRFVEQSQQRRYTVSEDKVISLQTDTTSL